MKTYILNGLDCAHCAEKIEREVNEISGVESAKINFISKRITVDAEGKKVLCAVKNKIHEIEPEIEISETDEENSDEKLMILRILSAFAIFFTAFFVKNSIYPLIFLLSYVIIGTDVLISALKRMISGKVFDEKFLMTVATIGAIIIGEYPEAAAVMLFYQTGELLNRLAVGKSRNAINALAELLPEYAEIEENGEIIKKKPEQVKVGEITVVKPGEKIALDGEVCFGAGEIDVSALTGESMPQFVTVGDAVTGGSINTAALMKVRVTKPYTQCVAAKITETVISAADKKSQQERFVTKFSKYYTPCVVAGAVLMAALGAAITGKPSVWVHRSLQFLVISCPCALVLSIPLGFAAGTGKAARQGILVKGSSILEKIASVKIAAFDKTGTLTEGRISAGEVLPADDVSEKELMKIAASIEGMSTHPVARGIAGSYDGEVYEVYEITEIPGYGISGKINGKTVIVGNERLMAENGIDFAKKGQPAIYVAMDGKYLGSIGLQDKIRQKSKGLADKLKKVGVRSVAVLSGDTKAAVLTVAELAGADLHFASLLPQDKAEICRKLKKDGTLIFLGDGINDAPVIAEADVGVAMGENGSDIATQTADVILMGEDPSKIVTAIITAKKTVFRIKQNIYFVLGIKLIVLLLGAFGITNMQMAVFADVGVALLATLNSVRK